MKFDTLLLFKNLQIIELDLEKANPKDCLNISLFPNLQRLRLIGKRINDFKNINISDQI